MASEKIFPSIITLRDFPGGPVVKNVPSSAPCACLCAESLQSCPTMCDPMDCGPYGSSVCGDSPDKDAGVGCHALLQGIFPTQRSNLCFICLLPWRAVLYHYQHPMQGTWVQSLGRELRSHVPQGSQACSRSRERCTATKTQHSQNNNNN